jgi:hypothetical protein
MTHRALRASRALRGASAVLLLAAFGCDDSSENEGTQEPITETDASHEAPADAGAEPDAGQPAADDASVTPLDAGGEPDAGEAPDAGNAADAGNTPDAGDGDTDAATDPEDGGQVADECSTTVAAADGNFVELCSLSAPVRHVRIEGLVAPRVHAATQVLFGFPATPASTNPTIGEGQLQALFYGGGVPFPAPMVVRRFGAHETTLSGDAGFVNAVSTVCFDVHDGSAERPPYFVLWVDGQRGASCAQPATLTLDSAFGSELAGPTGAIARQTPVFFRQAAAQEATVTVSSQPVLGADLLGVAASSPAARR